MCQIDSHYPSLTILRSQSDTAFEHSQTKTYFGISLATYERMIINMTKGDRMSFIKKLLLTLTVFTLSAYTAFAQGQAPAQAQQGQAQAADVSDKMLDKFVSVQPKIGNIASEYEQELQGVKDTSKAQEIQTKYNKKMVKAIEKGGMSAQDYNTVSNAINSNPDIRDRYMEKVQ